MCLVPADADKIKALEHLAIDTGRSVSSLMAEAIKDFLIKYSSEDIAHRTRIGNMQSVIPVSFSCKSLVVSFQHAR